MKFKTNVIKLSFLLVGMMLLTITCNKEEDEIKIILSTPKVATTIVSKISQSEATSGGNITNDGGAKITARGVCWSKNTNPSTTNSKTIDGVGKGNYISDITSLEPNTTYYIRAYATNSIGTSYGEQISFTTLNEVSAPTVTTSQATSITKSSATIGGEIVADGGNMITERGVVYSTTENPTMKSNKAVSEIDDSNKFAVDIDKLKPNTKYYARAYATNSIGTSYGEQISFTTLNEVSAPTVTTSQATSITKSSATIGGEIVADGNNTITERGVIYSTTENPTLKSSKVVSEIDDSNKFTVDIDNLKPNTKYYARAYATNSIGTSYGEQISFTTLNEVSAPTVTTSQATSITKSSATIGGEIVADGNNTITERGVVFSTTENPTMKSNKAVSEIDDSNKFAVDIDKLKPNTKYYARAYATNSIGTSYGEQISFTTLNEVSAPTVTTSQATSITKSSATIGGEIVADGGNMITERGVVYSTTENPTLKSSKVVSEIDDSNKFTVDIDNLKPNTKYYARAYATNSIGTSYGEQISFTTLNEVSAPTVTTSQATSITKNNATIGGEIVADGGNMITERGVVYSTTENPTLKSSKVVSEIDDSNKFTVDIDNLKPNTKYYARAYATNSIGTSYGEQISFTTLNEVSAPTVTTSQATSITKNNATIGGEIVADGNNTITERGVFYSTTENPTMKSNKAVSEIDDSNKFAVDIDKLKPNTKYYARAYATNSIGTSYGEQISFTTLNEVSAPTVTTSQATSITKNNATIGGEIVADGNNTITERGVVYSTTENPTMKSNKAVSEIDDSNKFAVDIDKLKPNTKYYARAYATNSIGTSYGNEITFVTHDAVLTLTDSRDGHVYKTVEIGNQVWMAENLKYLPKVHSNDEFESAGINKQPGYGVLEYTGNNLSSAKEHSNYKTYGALYNMYAIQNNDICPKGWHVPSKQEWDILVDFLGGMSVAGGKLKEEGTKHWSDPNAGANNESGFTALPGKFRIDNGVYFALSVSGMWWTSSFSGNPVDAPVFVLDSFNRGVTYTDNIQQWGVSVRCIRD